jgi:hypothetical protein
MIYVSFFRIHVFRETFSPTNIWPATPKLHIGTRKDIQVVCPLILSDETEIRLFRYTLVELSSTNKMQKYAGIYLLQNHSTYFGCPSHPSSGVHKSVTAAFGTGHSNNIPPT